MRRPALSSDSDAGSLMVSLAPAIREQGRQERSHTDAGANTHQWPVQTPCPKVISEQSLRH